jgi:ABC-type antimicrobial peptide transport system permease subunit
MQALLFGVGAADPLSFGLGALVLLAVAAMAAYLPACRASRIEPMVGLSR